MATNFEGSLLIVLGDNANQFPNEYIQFNTWKTTPNQREEIRAYRDENTRNLTRVTAAGRKSVISFSTRPNLHLADKIRIQTLFSSNYLDADQRKVELKFWNDETNNYATGIFYIPNIEFKIKKVTSNDIIYDVIEFSFVEY